VGGFGLWFVFDSFLDLGMCLLRKSPRWRSCLFSPGREFSQKSQSSLIMVLSWASCSLSTQTECPPQWWFRWLVRGMAPGLLADLRCLRARRRDRALAKVLW